MESGTGEMMDKEMQKKQSEKERIYADNIKKQLMILEALEKKWTGVGKTDP